MAPTFAVEAALKQVAVLAAVQGVTPVRSEAPVLLAA